MRKLVSAWCHGQRTGFCLLFQSFASAMPNDWRQARTQGIQTNSANHLLLKVVVSSLRDLGALPLLLRFICPVMDLGEGAKNDEILRFPCR